MIDVAFTRATIAPARLAVVIDVLRASSSITQALAGGYRRVMCCRTLADAVALRAPGRVLAGERDCVPPPGFDLGNSPSGFRSPRGEEVVLTTTNGTPALLEAAASADEVLIGCLLNLRALLAHIDELAPGGDPDVILICAGTHGRPALEDVYLAGRIAGALGGARTDAARVAEAVAASYREPRAALAASADAAVLEEVGLGRDIDCCARESVLDVVPRTSALEQGVAIVEPAPTPGQPASAGPRSEERPLGSARSEPGASRGT